MFDYLNKFKNLNDDVKKAVDSDEAVTIIEELEKKYKVDLASIVMRVAIKDININNLPLIFFTELNLSQNLAEDLAKELEEKIFYKIADYLGMKKRENEVEIEQSDSINPLGDVDLAKDLRLLGEEFEGLSNEMVDDLNDQEFVSDYIKSDYLDKIKNQVNQVFEILNFNFSGEKKEKFVSYLEKYFKGIKSKIELRQSFVKSVELGGFGLTDKMIDNVFMVADSLKDEEYQEIKNQTKVDKNVLEKINKLGLGASLAINTSKALSSPEPSHLLSQPDSTQLLPPPDSSHLISGPDKDKLSETLKKQKELLEKIENKSNNNNNNNNNNNQKKEEEVGVALDDKFLEKQDSDFSKFEEEILSEIDEQISKESKLLEEKSKNLSQAEITTNISPNIAFKTVGKNDDLLDGNKIKMTDVKKVKIMTPVDEIRYLDLTNFRRLSKDPKEALEKIREKIRVLEGLDYTKMIEGIKAWRQSPIHKLYLKIFLEVGNRGLSLEQVISELKSYGKDFLSKEEIDAIIEFNKTLRF